MARGGGRAGPWGCVAALAVVIAAAGTAWACTPSAYIMSDPSSGAAGSSATISGRYFYAEPVQLRWNTTSGPVLAQSSGPDFVVSVKIPDVAPGVYYIVATADRARVSASFQVTAPATTTTGPSTTTVPPPAETSGGSSAPAQDPGSSSSFQPGSSPPSEQGATPGPGGSQPVRTATPADGDSPSANSGPSGAEQRPVPAPSRSASASATPPPPAAPGAPGAGGSSSEPGQGPLPGAEPAPGPAATVTSGTEASDGPEADTSTEDGEAYLSTEDAASKTKAAEERRDIAGSVALLALGAAILMSAQGMLQARRRGRSQ